MELTVYRSQILILIGAAFVGVLSTFIYKRKRNHVPKEWVQVGKVLKIHLYPLKSGRRVNLEKAEVLERGLRQMGDDANNYRLRDRELIVYNAKDFELRTARTYPKMVLIETNIHDKNKFALDAPDMKTLLVEIPTATRNDVVIKYFSNEIIPAVDCGDEAATWCSRYILGKDSGLRLAYFLGENRRDVETAYSEMKKLYKNLKNEYSGRFSDYGAIHLINQSSVAALNKRLGDSKVVPENFRPNFVIESEAWSENSWDFVKIGDVVLKTSKPCTRCVFTTIDPETGIRNADGEPLKNLKQYNQLDDEELRKVEHNAPAMGLYLGLVKSGVVNLGDAVYVPK